MVNRLLSGVVTSVLTSRVVVSLLPSAKVTLRVALVSVTVLWLSPVYSAVSPAAAQALPAVQPLLKSTVTMIGSTASILGTPVALAVVASATLSATCTSGGVPLLSHWSSSKVMAEAWVPLVA